MPIYRITAADRQTGREVRVDLDAASESEAAQIVTRFALVRQIDQTSRRDDGPRSGMSAAAAPPPPPACPRCGLVFTGSSTVVGVAAGGGGRGPQRGPDTSIGTLSAPFTLDRTIGGRAISGHQLAGGAIALLGVPVLVVGLVWSGRPEPAASRGDALMVAAGVLLAVGLGWLIVGSLLGGRGRK